MAIEHDISDLLNKREDEGTSSFGRLTAAEWNKLVGAVGEVQDKVENTTNIKGILYKDTEVFNTINKDGYLLFSPQNPQGDVRINILSKPKAYIASDADCKVTFQVNSRIPSDSGEGTVSSELGCKVNFYIDNGTNSDEDKSRRLVGTDTIYDIDLGIAGVKKEITFDFANQKIALAKGEDAVNVLTIEVNNGYGNTITANVTVRVIDLSMVVNNFPTTKVYTENNKPQIRVTVYGSNAQIFADVDNKNVLVAGEAIKGVPKTFSRDLFDIANVNTHGVHTIKLWASVTKDVGNGETETISTNPVEYNYIYGTTLASPIVMANIANKEPEQYMVFNATYIAYKYNSSNTAVIDDVKTSIYEITGKDGNGNPIIGRELTSSTQTLTFDSISNSASGSASLSLFPVSVKKNPSKEDSEYEEVELVGEMAVVITIGDYQYVDTINIKHSSVTLSEVSGYAVRLSSSGRSNKEANNIKRIWESIGVDENNNVLKTNVTFDESIEFEDTGSGWIYDGDKYDPNDPNDKGNVALRLRKGRYCTLNFNPFKTNPTYSSEENRGTGYGMTISIEFATRNALNQQAKVISCLSNDKLGNPRGFEVLANKATIYSKLNTLYADFKEDTRIKLDFVIDGEQYAYPYDTTWTEDGGNGDTFSESKTEFEALAIIYVDGVYQALTTIPSGDSYVQSNAVPITFGSDECDIDIYNIRIYNTALSPIQIVQNYAYDTPNVKNKLEIARRNQDVLTYDQERPHKPNIDIEGLRKARPLLPLFFIEMDTNEHKDEVLPKDKKNWKLLKNTIYQRYIYDSEGNKKLADSQLNGNASFEIPFAVLRNQGTSSMSYPWPWRNWDWKTGDATFPVGEKKYYIPTIDDPQAIKTNYWAQYDGMNSISPSEGKGNIRKITLKKDYASSEMCNNAITSEMFTDMARGIGDAKPGVLSPAQRATGGKNSPYRLTFVAHPCFMIRKYSDPTKPGSAGAGYEALGMMNLIPNKNECAYLGFFDQWVWDPNNDKRAQSWELRDNYPEIFWKKELKTIEKLATPDKEGKNWKNDIAGNYEARYPKDTTVFFKEVDGKLEADGDFGMVKEKTISDQQILDVKNEQKDLIEFHNWLVSTNRQIPIEYKAEHGDFRGLDDEELAASWNLDKDDNPIYTQDTPSYRLAKFEAEADDHMIIDQFVLYYIWREMFWAYDSGLKNLQIYTMGYNPKFKNPNSNTPMWWGCMVRDADTTLGIQNQGRIEFPPYLEDTDYYTESNGQKIWHFDTLKNSYDQSDITRLKGVHVLNGQLAPLWINLRDAFDYRIKAIYNALSANKDTTHWSAGKAIKRFRDHQEKWCESLYNWGMRQYFGGKPFTKWIESGLGDKKNSRASWLQQAFNYRNAKYRAFDGDNCIVTRPVLYETPDNEDGNTYNIPLKYKFYQPTYLCCGGNNINPDTCETHKRIPDVSNYIDVSPTELGIPKTYEGAMAVQYDASNIVEMGDIARVYKIYELQSMYLPKLKSLLLGKDPERGGDNITYHEYNADRKPVPISNNYLKSIDLSSLKQLQILDITNHTKLNSIDVSDCTELKELYAIGCNSATEIILPNTTTLETIHLPYSISNISLVNLSGIKKFKLDTPKEGKSYALSRLVIDNCGSYMASESYNIVKQVISNLEKVYDPEESNNNICTLYGVNWTNADSSYLERLLNIEAKLSGYIKVKNLSNDLKVRLIAAYGNIDDRNNGLFIEYIQEEITSAKLPSKMYFHIPGKHQLKFTVDPSTANTYSSAVWSISSNSYAGFANEVDAANGVLTRYEGEDNQQTSATLTVVIKQLPYSDGGTRKDITLESTVYFYERLARPGDYVFNDGTYSDELDDSKAPIGVCFYVDPENSENRLMMALNSVQYLRDDSTMVWGLGIGGSNNDGTYYGSPQGVTIDNYSCYDIEKLPPRNITEAIIDPNENTYFTDSVYRDDFAADNAYFKKYSSTSYFGNIGWKKASNRIYIDKLQQPDGSIGSILINVGDSLPVGYINTLTIIEHRNKLLDSYSDEETREFIRPYHDNYITETESLRELGQIADKADVGGRISANTPNRITNGSHLYYPAASMAFAYKPNVSGLGLLDKFKEHNWFLPSSGELIRMCYYAYQSYLKDENGIAKPQESPVNSKYGSSYNEPANAFYRAIKDGKLSMNNFYTGNKEAGTSMWSSTESNTEKNAIYISSNNGKPTPISKSSTYYVRPICRF